MANAFLLNKIWLKSDETPILLIRRSSWNWLLAHLISAAMFFGAFFIMPYLWRYGWQGLAGFSALIVVSLLIFGRALYERYFTCWVLTNLRLIDIYQRGYFHRETSEAVYAKIKDVVSAKSGLFSSLFNLGDITVSLSDSRVKLLLSGVRGHERAISEIILQQENYMKSAANDLDSGASKALQRIKNKIGSAELNKLLGE